MKKILLILILLLGLGGAGAGYYLFFMVPKKDVEPTPITDVDKPVTEKSDSNSSVTPVRQIRHYFVKERKLAVMNGPGDNYFPERYVYIGDPITVLEHKGDWGRVSPYFVYQEGDPEVAEWVKLSGLATSAPTLSKEEKEEIVTGYIGRSDNFKDYREAFIKVTEKLLDEKVCTPDDFEELKGWMRSINYKNRNVYFIYCGGLKVSDKIYFDVDSGKVFYQ